MTNDQMAAIKEIRYSPLMRICVIMHSVDSFKGGNHLPLFAALPHISFTILTNRVKLDDQLPNNIHIEQLHEKLGPYYHGIADARLARAVLTKYPPHDPYWKQFDVIHLNQTLHPRLIDLEQSGKPVLYLVHHPVTADREVACQETTGWERLHWKFRYLRLIGWQRAVCTKASRILTVSQTVTERLTKDYGVAADKMKIVPNGVDGEIFKPSDQAKTSDCIAVGSFLHPRKGFKYLAEVYRALAADGRRIADVGRRSPEQRNILAEIPGVTTYGEVSHDQLTGLMRTSRCLLSTSLYEGFGLSLIEALACGLPAFAFANGAVPEVLSPIDPTLLVPSRDTTKLIERVREFLVLSEQEQAVAGKRYRSRVLELYPLQKAANGLEQQYQQIQGISLHHHLL